MLQTKQLSCDLCVIGGGIAGICTAISAAREGLHVVLMHERPVLGGNASSEIRMWISGARGEDNRETGILEEIELENMYRNPTKSYAIWDTVLYDFVHREENIQLLLNCTCLDAKTSSGVYPHGRDKRITSVTGYQMTTQCFIEVGAPFFCDCSGDSILAPLTGATFRIGREAASEFGELSSTHIPDRKTMGMSCLIQGRETTQPVAYIPPSWHTPLGDTDFQDRMPNLYDAAENFWYLELGGNRDSIADTEDLRHELLSLATGTWDYIKNSGQFRADHWDLDFLGFLPGKRESRRMMGEYIITQQDISNGVVFDDEIAYGGWPLDDHFPDGFHHKGTPNTDYQTPAPYSLPYRALYSQNVDNLFFAGRNISMTHMAMSSIRVMATCGLLGEAVGKAAAIAHRNRISPQDVFLCHIPQLQQRLLESDCFLPSKVRPIHPICLQAHLTGAPESIRNGQDRAHRIYGTTEQSAYAHLAPRSSVTYHFAPAKVSSVHIVFSSDLNRNSLDGTEVERRRATRANLRLDSPQLHMPGALCREFRLIGLENGHAQELLHITENRKRCYHLQIDQTFDTLVLLPLSSWGHETIDLISFDFSATKEDVT